MLLRIKGKPINIKTHLVGKVTRKTEQLDENSFLLVDHILNKLPLHDFKGILTCQNEYQLQKNEQVVFKIPTLEHLSEGDIVSVGNGGNINTLYRLNSHHNTLLVTERCNSNCLMCSQPPKNRDDIDYHYNIFQKLIPMIPKSCKEVGISGGEPTLMGDKFFKVLKLIRKELPETEIHVLTNGRSFAWFSFTENFKYFNTSRIMLGVPLYSDYYQQHDYVVQAPNAFNQTILGLYNLARYNQRIEIRVVLHKLTIPRLTKLAKFIYKNLPFVEHIAFMGLEYTGYTKHNIDKLWIDPFDYQQELEEAVLYLASKGMNVSIYNLQLCVMPRSLWKFARKSISDWKNSYLPECITCSKINECGGFFTWNLKKHSDYIKPIITD